MNARIKTILIGIGIIGAVALIAYAVASMQYEPASPVPQVITPTGQQPVLILSAVQIQATYQASTSKMTVEQLDVQGASMQGENVHLTCILLRNVTQATGMNKQGRVQLALPDAADVHKLHEGDMVEIWGVSEGVTLGTQGRYETGVTVMYLYDTSSKYTPPLPKLPTDQ